MTDLGPSHDAGAEERRRRISFLSYVFALLRDREQELRVLRESGKKRLTRREALRIQKETQQDQERLKNEIASLEADWAQSGIALYKALDFSAVIHQRDAVKWLATQRALIREEFGDTRKTDQPQTDRNARLRRKDMERDWRAMNGLITHALRVRLKSPASQRLYGSLLEKFRTIAREAQERTRTFVAEDDSWHPGRGLPAVIEAACRAQGWGKPQLRGRTAVEDHLAASAVALHGNGLALNDIAQMVHRTIHLLDLPLGAVLTLAAVKERVRQAINRESSETA